MKKLLYLALLCIVVNDDARGQQLFFPKNEALTVSMPALATQVATQLKKEGAWLIPDGDQEFHLTNLMTAQMVAAQYTAAIKTISACQDIYRARNPDYAAKLLMPYQTFCKAKIRAGSMHEPFALAFKTVFLDAFHRLSEKDNFDTDSRFLQRISTLETEFNSALEKQHTTDSIPLVAAIFLCSKYNALQVFKTIVPLAKPLLAAEDRKHYIIQGSVLIKTRDGAFISVVVVRKKAMTHALPVVFVFNIYARTRDISDAREAAANGYVGVVANTRGKRLSPDEIVPYEHDGNDAYDVIDWISKQPWCNGKVGMYQGSYCGFTQWASTKHGVHPALKTIVPSAAVVPGYDVPKMNNVFMNFVYSWIPYVTNNKFLDDVTYDDNARWNDLKQKWFASGAAYRSLDSIDGHPNKIFQRWLDHPAYDEYWQNMTAYQQDFANINIPILSTTGYYDGAQVGAMYYFNQHHQYNQHANHYLLIGPFDHFGSQRLPTPYLRGYKIDDVANINIHAIIYQWFDYILRGGTKPAILKDKINYQVMGSNEWKHAPSLQQMNNDTLTFYLSDTISGIHHSLTGQKPSKQLFFSQKVDFADRSTQNNYATSSLIDTAFDAGNGLSFISKPFRSSFEINGSFSGEIKIAINKKDLDYSVDLYELMPDGKYFFLSYFLGRASYATDITQRHLLQPGVVTGIPFSNTYFTSRKISKGSRLVIVLNANKHPHDQINYGTGKDVSSETIADAQVPLEIKWYNNSFIKIPVFKYDLGIY
ncbi:hypothetical protein CLV51_107214 [Chitinophaga niastensis]|uniref:Xaa-Pro dipeptidyl-peptidase C-terminal domain-containing protein n=1 Tax=Chitinophaga niastensis TaxID=536980 RepID=A0A2P8HCK5_CHINA|nr:CocE/NonD family hydrolase [Chitinophaga niastensis]PSL43902.1 hypothetical protein CLV51_107214 [Chitinophaga niastensis]